MTFSRSYSLTDLPCHLLKMHGSLIKVKHFVSSTSDGCCSGRSVFFVSDPSLAYFSVFLNAVEGVGQLMAVCGSLVWCTHGEQIV